MTKSLVLGNGSMLIGLDMHGQIKDLYYDYVGLDDHLTEEAVCKIGFWVDDKISWLSDPGWKIDITYRDGTMAGRIEATSAALELKITFLDVVYNEKSIVVRSINVHNIANRQRNIKVFLNHQLRMFGMLKKDTVYFDPADGTIIHYKGRRLALIGGRLGQNNFSDYTVGLSNIEGKEGTWRDAEDGLLSKNPIEHGTVDSTIAFEETVDTDKAFTVNYWICFGKTLEEVKGFHEYILIKTPDHLIETTQNYWKAWITKTIANDGLSDKVYDLYKKSLFVVRAHTDNTGAIIASSDSGMLQYGRDNYTYVWHRDGAFVSMALDFAGYHEVAKRFYEFSNDTLTVQGYFFHKYRADKALGSSWHGWVTSDGQPRLPIQEDETALVVSALWKHYEKTKDLEFIENVYNSLIKPASEFMLGFRGKEKLPNPTYDLWEQDWGIHTFTVATVFDALRASSRFADILGKNEDQEHYIRAAGEIKEAFEKYMVDSKNNFFYKSIDFNDGQALHNETIDMSSFYGVFKFGLLDIDDDRLKSAHEVVLQKLMHAGGIGGVCRYENDNYYRVEGDYPGNPWIITTLWLAQYYIQKAQSKKDLKPAEELLSWTVDRALPSGILPEQINPFSGEPLSATPLTWSHAEFVTTTTLYLEKLKQLKQQ